MPLPLVLGIGAAIAAAGGVGAGINGAAKMIEANDTMKITERKQQRALRRLNEENKASSELMDSIGTQELNILSSFEKFSNLIEKIQGRPVFKEYKKNGVTIPKYEAEELKKVYVGAGLLLGGLSGTALGTAGGFAASGATTAAVMALGTASTGTAISSLSGVALTNATLAALGGGSLAAGGGGIALGTTILGVATAGVGILVGGVIFNITGSKLSAKADDAYYQAKETEKEVNKICEYLTKLSCYARRFRSSLSMVEKYYREHLDRLENIIETNNKNYWNNFTNDEKLITENTVLLVGLLYKMCQVQLVLKDNGRDGTNEINVKDIIDIESNADEFIANNMAS